MVVVQGVVQVGVVQPRNEPMLAADAKRASRDSMRAGRRRGRGRCRRGSEGHGRKGHGLGVQLLVAAVAKLMLSEDGKLFPMLVGFLVAIKAIRRGIGVGTLFRGDLCLRGVGSLFHFIPIEDLVIIHE